MSHAQSRRFLQSIEDNFLMQVVEEPMRRDELLDLILTTKEGLVEDVRVGCTLGCSDHEMVEFKILRCRSRAMSRVTNLDFKLWPLQRPARGIPWARALEGKRGPGELDSVRGPLPPSSKSMHPQEEVRQRSQETCMDEQRVSRETQMEEGGSQYAEKRTGHLGGI